MKKIILPILLGVFSLYSQGNVVFADANFKETVLKSSVNSNNDSEISTAEALAADSLAFNINNPLYAINSYEDLQFFPQLKYLKINEMYYNSVPKTIDFGILPHLKKLIVYSLVKNITSNHLSALDSLESLDLTGGNSIIDLSNLKRLHTLSLNSIGNTPQLPSNLKKLSIDGADFTLLDLSNCMLPNSAVSISFCTKLKTLVLPTTKLQRLELYYLYELPSLDLSQCMVPSNKVIISMCTKLHDLGLVSSGQLDTLVLDNLNLSTIDLSTQTRLEVLNINYMKDIKAINLPIPNNLEFIDIKYSNFNGNLDFSNLDSLKGLSVSGKFIDTIFLPVNGRLQHLNIPDVYNPSSLIGHVANLDQQVHLADLYFSGAANGRIDISKMERLKRLSYKGETTKNHARFVCIKDTNQLERLDIYDTDHYVHFVTCHDVASNLECGAHVTAASICDDFKDASPGDGSNDEYAIVTDKPAWLYNMPSPYVKASMGAFWTLPAQSADFITSKSRNHDGSLTFNITTTSTLVQPMMLSFGTYADGNKENKFTLDLSNNAVVSFELSNIKNMASNLIVELEDIHGNTLRLDKKVLLEETKEYYGHYQIGIPVHLVDLADNKINGILVNSQNALATSAKYLPDFAPKSNEVHKFYYDFKNAICGKFEKIALDKCCVDSLYTVVPKPELHFDYKQVALVKLMRITNDPNDLVTDGNDYSFTISNFKMGAVDYTVGIENEMSERFENEVFKVYDMQGAFVAEGAWNQLRLDAMQLYILKSKQRTFKLLVNDR